MPAIIVADDTGRSNARALPQLAWHKDVKRLLEVRDIALRFGGIIALDGVSFEIEEGQILGLIGPNGAGKTTLFNCISRLYTPNSGDILFEGRSMLARPPHRIAEIGIGRTFQNLALFAPQSVLDNVRIGAHAHSRSDFGSDAWRLPWGRRQETAVRETARSLLHMLDLEGDTVERDDSAEPQGDIADLEKPLHVFVPGELR